MTDTEADTRQAAGEAPLKREFGLERSEHGSSPARRRAQSAFTAAAASGIVLCAMLEGAVHGAPALRPLPEGSRPDRTRPPLRDFHSATGGQFDSGIVLMVAAAVAAVLLVLVLTGLRRRAARRRPPRPGPSVPPELSAAAGTADAPSVRRGIAAALEVLAEDRPPADAVVRAWLGLQQSAEDAGVARPASETPTEFTGRVLSRTSADRADLRVLLALYLRARFSEQPVTATDAATAIAVLRALESSWQPAAPRVEP